MKLLKRIVMTVVIYFIWKQISVPFLIVFTAFFGKYLVKEQDAATFKDAQNELMRHFNTWIQGVDPNLVTYCAFFGVTIILLYGLYRLDRSFPLTRRFAIEPTIQSGGSVIDNEGKQGATT
jgi:hypothetical protein